MSDLIQKQESISYDKLYRQWERTNWSATNIDFTRDKIDWVEKLDDKQRTALLWNYSLFLVGEEAVARDLTPVLDAATGFPESIFLTTQIVDEARHHVFFDRFMREVAGLGSDTATTLDAVESYLTWGFKQVFEELDRVTDRLRRKPKDKTLLTQSVALYHVVVEGMLAIAGQHFIQRYLNERAILPGFSEGSTTCRATSLATSRSELLFWVISCGHRRSAAPPLSSYGIEFFPGPSASSSHPTTTATTPRPSASRSRRSTPSDSEASKPNWDASASTLGRSRCCRSRIGASPTRNGLAVCGCSSRRVCSETSVASPGPVVRRSRSCSMA